MDLIRQVHKTGCAIASVAMMANIAYKDAIKKVLPRKKKHADYGATIPNIAKGLMRLGFMPSFYFKKKVKLNKIKRNAILLLQENDYDGHAVVWDSKRKVVLDPEFDKALSLRDKVEDDDGNYVTVNKYYQDKFFAYITIRKPR
jgi:ABC-type bacteriocin/lantibiotic exporter with double-glycine peptidase domain